MIPQHLGECPSPCPNAAPVLSLEPPLQTGSATPRPTPGFAPPRPSKKEKGVGAGCAPPRCHIVWHITPTAYVEPHVQSRSRASLASREQGRSTGGYNAPRFGRVVFVEGR